MKKAVIEIRTNSPGCNKNSRFPCPVNDSILHSALVRAIASKAVELGWSSNRISKEAGLSKGNWSEIKNQKKSPRLSSVEKLCAALGLSVAFESINPASLPDASGTWWQWHQDGWRLCQVTFSRHDARWDYRWINGDQWFVCQPGFFTRCNPPEVDPTISVTPRKWSLPNA